MRKTPVSTMLEAVAPTLACDSAAIGVDRAVPFECVSRITSPTLIIDGGADLRFMKQTALSLSRAIPNAKLRTLEGRTYAAAPSSRCSCFEGVFREPFQDGASRNEVIGVCRRFRTHFDWESAAKCSVKTRIMRSHLLFSFAVFFLSVE